MTNEVSKFLWMVHKSGYCWTNDSDKDARKLSEIDGPDTGIYRRYDPLRDHSALFRDFADTVLTEEGIIAFANQYGNIGNDSMEATFYNWKLQIKKMRQAVTLLDLLRYGNRDGLSQFINREYNADHCGRSETTWALLSQLVNENLKEVFPRLVYCMEAGEISLRNIPNSLTGCLWLQLADAISRGKEQRKCIVCGKWFEVSAAGSRSDKKYCTVACRNRAHHEKVKEAVRMRSEGKTPKQIAESLGVELDSVKEWLAKSSSSKC